MPGPTRRTVGLGTAALAGLGASTAAPTGDAALFATLDATGALVASTFHPGKVLASAKALLAVPPADRVAALRRYLARGKPWPEGLFAVVRMLVEVPPRTAAPTPWPGVLQPGYLRPPAFGAPVPVQPAELWQFPYWPVVVLGDVPLSVVQGYELGGLAEPLGMHLDGLAGATWRTAVLAPVSAGVVRYDLVHWGAFTGDRVTSALLEGQLGRYEAGAP